MDDIQPEISRLNLAQNMQEAIRAAEMAGIPHIIFGLHDKVVHSNDTLEANPYIRRHIKSYCGGVLTEESAALFAKYDPKTLK